MKLSVLNMNVTALNYAVALVRGQLLESGAPSVMYHVNGDDLLALMDEFELFPAKEGVSSRPIYSIMINPRNVVPSQGVSESPFNCGYKVFGASISEVVLKAYLIGYAQHSVFISNPYPVVPKLMEIDIPTKFLR